MPCDEDMSSSTNRRDLTRYGRDYYVASKAPKRTPSWLAKRDKPELVQVEKNDSFHVSSNSTSCNNLTSNNTSCNNLPEEFGDDKSENNQKVETASCMSSTTVSSSACTFVHSNNVKSNTALSLSSNCNTDINMHAFSSWGPGASPSIFTKQGSDSQVCSKITNVNNINDIPSSTSTNQFTYFSCNSPFNDNSIANRMERSSIHNNSLRSSLKSNNTREFCLNPLFENSSSNIEFCTNSSYEIKTELDNRNILAERTSSESNIKSLSSGHLTMILRKQSLASSVSENVQQNNLKLYSPATGFPASESSKLQTKESFEPRKLPSSNNCEVASPRAAEKLHDYYSSYESLPYLSNFNRNGSLRLPRPVVSESVFEPLFQRSQSLRVRTMNETKKNRPSSIGLKETLF